MKEGRPRVIIRRRKAAPEGHYGGAWKIALADFMTAMMALFLVLWVISTATPEQLRGLADYFSTPLAQAMAQGPRQTASDSVIPGGGPDPTYNEGERANVHLRPQPRPSEARQRLRRLRERIDQAVQADVQLSGLREQMFFQMTEQGLRVQLTDTDRRPMFEMGSDRLEPYMRQLLAAIAPLLNEQDNDIIINGYTDSHQYLNGDAGYGNWELSSARANASRRELVSHGLDADKLLVVSGMADRVPLPGTRPSDAVNRRIEILILTPHAAGQIRNEASLGSGIDLN